MSRYTPHPDPQTEAGRVALFEGWTAALCVSLEARIAVRRQSTERAGIGEQEWLDASLPEREAMLRRARRRSR